LREALLVEALPLTVAELVVLVVAEDLAVLFPLQEERRGRREFIVSPDIIFG